MKPKARDIRATAAKQRIEDKKRTSKRNLEFYQQNEGTVLVDIMMDKPTTHDLSRHMERKRNYQARLARVKSEVASLPEKQQARVLKLVTGWLDQKGQSASEDKLIRRAIRRAQHEATL